MSWRFIEGRIFRMLWQSHSGFDAEFTRLRKKVRTLDDSLKKAKKLLEVQFDPANPQQCIAPAKIHRVHSEGVWTLWKLEMATMGLRPNQFPRVWLVVSGNTITLVAIASHIQNYDDGEVGRCALERFSEIA